MSTAPWFTDAEVDYLRAAGGGESESLATAIGHDNLAPGILGIRRHRLEG